MRYWGDIELPDEDQLTETKYSADPREIDVPHSGRPETRRGLASHRVPA